MNENVWKQIAIHAVGGLIQVGYANDSDFLMVLSHNGLGIFDCLTGERIARDKEYSYDDFDESSLIIKGFDILEGQEIKTSGLFGGSISVKTRDGWMLLPRASKLSFNELYLVDENNHRQIFIGAEVVEEIRAFGFSETEKSFIIATSGDLIIYTR